MNQDKKVAVLPTIQTKNAQAESVVKLTEVLATPVQAADILGKQQDVAEQVAKLDQKVEHLMETLIKAHGVYNQSAVHLRIENFSVYNLHLPNSQTGITEVNPSGNRVLQ